MNYAILIYLLAFDAHGNVGCFRSVWHKNDGDGEVWK